MHIIIIINEYNPASDSVTILFRGCLPDFVSRGMTRFLSEHSWTKLKNREHSAPSLEIVGRPHLQVLTDSVCSEHGITQMSFPSVLMHFLNIIDGCI